jgi:hypothetical protein
VRHVDHQAFGPEQVEYLAHGHRAHAESARELVDDEALAGGQLATHDGIA